MQNTVNIITAATLLTFLCIIKTPMLLYTLILTIIFGYAILTFVIQNRNEIINYFKK